MYRPHPFSWVPAAGQRHASTESRPPGRFPTGMAVTVLCGEHLRADNSELAWLWSTCPLCNEKAHLLAGIPLVIRR
ncbi:zinc finger protein [Saccharopolyspora sp. NPDC050389]|uniref:zinc finger protein n=1 Tax=Saccharopolyspora sp. NPDC050389 TaxID=3155516 RepID=UPI0033CDB24C